MKLYKDPQNNIHQLDSSEFEYLLPVGSINITQEEADTLKLSQIPIKSLVDKKSEMWVKIKTERDRRIQTGGYKVGSKWYHSDTFSRTQQMGLVMLGVNIPANTPWKTMDGTFVIMTQLLANQIFGTAAASDIAIFTAAELHKTNMELLSDPLTYNYSSNWPIIFGE